MKAKNEFTLVATRQGRIVGFANYYMMWFANKCVCCAVVTIKSLALNLVCVLVVGVA